MIGLGDADLYRQLLRELEVADEAAARLLEYLATHDLVGLEAEVATLDLAADERELLLRIPMLRGGPEVLEQARAMLRRRSPLAPPPGSQATFEALRAARRRRPGADSTSACCATSATTPARSSRSTTRRSATSSAAAAATTS